jgi:hypothetical protein
MVKMIVPALVRPAQLRRAAAYVDERDPARTAYADLRRESHPPPEDVPGYATRRWLA